MSAKQNRLFRTTMAVTLIIFVSKAGGFLREIIMTAYFGAGSDMDAYNMAYSLYYVPVLLFNSCITSTLVPLYMKVYRQNNPLETDRFSNNVISLFAFFAIIVAIAMYFLAGPMVGLMAQGFSADNQAVTTRLLQSMLPSLPFLVTSIVLSSILNAREKYMAAQLTGFPLTIALVGATVFFSKSAGIHALAWGVFISGILQVAVLMPFTKGIVHYRPRFDTSDENFKRLMILAGPAILSMAVNELNHMIDKLLASGLPAGHLTCMNLAFRLITFLVGVVLVPLETIVFSKMSMKTAGHDEKGLGRIVNICAELVALVILPVTAVGAVMSDDVIRLAYQHGIFSSESVSVAGIALRYYIIGVFSYGMRDIISRAFHACQDTKTPMYNAMLTVVMNIVLNIILVRVMGVGGLALATSISATLGVVSLLLLLRRKIGAFAMRKTLIELVKMLAATLGCAVVCVIVSALMPASQTFLQAFGRLVVGTGVAFIAYFIMVSLLRVRQLNPLKRMVLSKLHR